MKNCGNRFHTLVANKDVLGDLVKILSPKVCSCFLSFYQIFVYISQYY